MRIVNACGLFGCHCNNIQIQTRRNLYYAALYYLIEYHDDVTVDFITSNFSNLLIFLTAICTQLWMQACCIHGQTSDLKCDRVFLSTINHSAPIACILDSLQACPMLFFVLLPIQNTKDCFGLEVTTFFSILTFSKLRVISRPQCRFHQHHAVTQ